MKRLAVFLALDAAARLRAGPDDLREHLSPEARRAVLDSVFAAAASPEGFDGAPVVAILRRANIDPGTLFDRASRAGLYLVVQDFWDAAAAGVAIDDGASIRDQLFDLSMARFEAMDDQRAAALSIYEWARRPGLAGPANRVRAAWRSAQRLLFLAGVELAPLALADPRVAALAGALIRAEDAWATDENGDFARLMARLDGDLRQFEAWMRRTPFGDRAAAPASGPSESTGEQPA